MAVILSVELLQKIDVSLLTEYDRVLYQHFLWEKLLLEKNSELLKIFELYER